jgi:hypothetical protein
MARRDIFPDGNKRLIFGEAPAGTAFQEGPGRLQYRVSSVEMGTPVRTRELDIRPLETSENARRLLGSKTS